jgi:carboxymethylenebutenolidase
MTAAVEGHYGEDDPSISQEQAEALEAQLREAGVEVETFFYPGSGHAFFNDARPEAYNEEAARQAWIRTLEFLRKHLG